MDPHYGHLIASISGANAFLDEFLKTDSVLTVIDEQKFGAIIDAFGYLCRDLDVDCRQLHQREEEFEVSILPDDVCLTMVIDGITKLKLWQTEFQRDLAAKKPHILQDGRLRLLQWLRGDIQRAKLLLDHELTLVQDMETAYNELHEQAYYVRNIYIADLKQRAASRARGLDWQ